MIALAATLAVALGSSNFDAALARARELYNRAEWDAALRELTIAERKAENDRQRALVYLYQGVVLANVPDPESAHASWERALAIDPEAVLPLAVTRRIQAEFDARRQKARHADLKPVPAATGSAAPAPSPEPAPAVAPAPAPVEVTAEPARSLPVLPFVLGAIAVATGAVGGVMGGLSQGSVSAARAAPWYADKVSLHSQAQTQAMSANVLFAVAGGLALVTLVTFLLMR